jgi:hypothetical protein
MDGTVRHCLSWAEVQEVMASNALEKLGRMPEQLARYRQQTEVMRSEFVTVGDFILHHRFGFPYFTRPEDGKKYVVVPSSSGRRTYDDGGDETVPTSSEGSERVVWAKNDFPYALEADIGHFLLWSLQPLPPQQLEQLIRQRVAPDEEFVYFVNPPALQSVQNVFHAHVLVHHQSPSDKPTPPSSVPSCSSSTDPAPPELLSA